MSVEMAPLGEVATIVAGQSPPGSTYNDDCLGLPFFQGKADFGEIYPVARKWCVTPKKIAEAGDILISIRAPVGPTNIAKERCCIGRGLAAIRPYERVALRDFVHWAIRNSEAKLIAKGQGSTFMAISQKDLKGLSIPVPSLDEQRRIVRILNRAARIERLRAEARESLISFSAALFIEMFGNPSENPMGWEIMRLGSICRIVGGGTPRRGNDAYFGGDILWATPTDVTALNGILIDKTAETITDVGLKESSARLVPAGAVLMTSRATIGYTAIAARPMATNQGFANLICGDLLSPEYISSLLRNRREELIDLAAGTTFKEIPKSTLKNLRIPVPPLETQNKFKGILHRAAHAQMKDKAAAEIVSALNWSLMACLLEDRS